MRKSSTVKAMSFLRSRPESWCCPCPRGPTVLEQEREVDPDFSWRYLLGILVAPVTSRSHSSGTCRLTLTIRPTAATSAAGASQWPV